MYLPRSARTLPAGGNGVGYLGRSGTANEVIALSLKIRQF